MTRRWHPWIALLMLGVVLAAAIPSRALAGQPGPVVSDLVRETQKHSNVPGKLTMVWWLPEEFWSVSFQQSGSLTTEQQEAFLKTVRPYLLVAAVDGTIGPIGGSEFVDLESLRARIKVTDKKGRSYSPLPDDQLTGDVKNLSALLRSMFGNMLGAMGQGLHLFFFPAATTDGSSIAAATKEGTFSVEVGEQSFTWRLPLATLLSPKTCPVDGETMSGGWKYCPWHGKALENEDKSKKKRREPEPPGE